MHLGINALLDFFESRQGQSMVLVTVIGTRGSTYRKVGAMMLVAADGSMEGLISGGCLESDLSHHARRVMSDGMSRIVVYDMSAADDLVWGLGLGCDGAIELLLQPICSDESPHPLRTVADSIGLRRPILLALQATGLRDGVASESQWATYDADHSASGADTLLTDVQLAGDHWPDWRCKVDRDDSSVRAVVNVVPDPSVLICGAGPDAVPVVAAIVNLGWRCIVVDHRPAFAKSSRFPAGTEVITTRPHDLSEFVDLDTLDAAVVMSHHLQNDADYLRQLVSHDLAYIGLLGPRARRQKLIDMAECEHTDALFGPAGLDIGAELPTSIALSIVAELHAVLCARDGRSLLLRD